MKGLIWSLYYMLLCSKHMVWCSKHVVWHLKHIVFDKKHIVLYLKHVVLLLRNLLLSLKQVIFWQNDSLHFPVSSSVIQQGIYFVYLVYGIDLLLLWYSFALMCDVILHRIQFHKSTITQSNNIYELQTNSPQRIRVRVNLHFTWSGGTVRKTGLAFFGRKRFYRNGLFGLQSLLPGCHSIPICTYRHRT